MCCWIILRSSKVSRVCRIDSAAVGSSSIGNVVRLDTTRLQPVVLSISQLQTTAELPCDATKLWVAEKLKYHRLKPGGVAEPLNGVVCS
jgi:hypothetical protein